MGTQKAFAKPNTEDSRVDTDLIPHSSAAGEMHSLGICGNYSKDLGKVSSGI